MKVALIYASTTGNTEAMANALCDAIKSSGADVVLDTASNADKAAPLPFTQGTSQPHGAAGSLI